MLELISRTYCELFRSLIWVLNLLWELSQRLLIKGRMDECTLVSVSFLGMQFVTLGRTGTIPCEREEYMVPKQSLMQFWFQRS